MACLMYVYKVEYQIGLSKIFVNNLRYDLIIVFERQSHKGNVSNSGDSMKRYALSGEIHLLT